MSACAAIPIDGDGGLAAGLAAIDCQINGAVQVGYAQLFGASGMFGAVLRALLVVWVAMLALGLIGGRLRLSLPALGPRLFGVALVLTFATAWPAYQTVVYGLLVGGPDQIASAFLGAPHGATQAFASRLDGLLGELVELGRQFDAQAAAPQAKQAAKLVRGCALLLLLSTVGLLVVARLVLAALLALGPMFVLLALFRATRGLFEGWLRMALSFALVPMLVALAGAVLLRVLAPVIDAIALDPLAAAQQQRPLLMLLLGCAIYLGLLLAMAWTAAGLARAWRLGRGDRPADGGSSRVDVQARGAPAALSPARMHDFATEARIASAGSARTLHWLVGLARDSAPRTTPQASVAAVSVGSRRGGLGQGMRPRMAPRPLGGARTP
jgi:type IV secretion system protein VirB6